MKSAMFLGVDFIIDSTYNPEAVEQAIPWM